MTTDPFNSLQAGDLHAGFKVLRIVPLPDSQAVFYELIHENTCARYVHISTDDEENSFSVAFKTVPTDSTGVAHILEHTVLCGSKNFPVRDPFFSMIKRSLNTFMNAFTGLRLDHVPLLHPESKRLFQPHGGLSGCRLFPEDRRAQSSSRRGTGWKLNASEKGEELWSTRGLSTMR